MVAWRYCALAVYVWLRDNALLVFRTSEEVGVPNRMFVDST